MTKFYVRRHSERHSWIYLGKDGVEWSEKAKARSPSFDWVTYTVRELESTDTTGYIICEVK